MEKLKAMFNQIIKISKLDYYDPKLMKCVKDFLQFYEPVGPELQCYSVFGQEILLVEN